MVLELLVTVLVLALTGAGVASLLTTLSHDVQAALAIPLGWALVAATAPLVDVGAPPRLLTGTVVVAGVALTVVRLRSVAPMVRVAGLPAVIVVATLLVSAGPSIDRGTWATDTGGNADPYLWVSQARSLVDGVTPFGASTPDALATERLYTQQWSEAPPVALAALAGATRHDPAFIVFLLVAALAVVTPLVTYVAARAVLDFPPWLAAAAGIALGISALHQIKVVETWIPQLGGVSLALAAGVLLRCAYDAGGSRRLEGAAALCVAGALASYRLPVSGILALMLGVAFASAVIDGRRPIVRPTFRFAAATALLATLSLLQLALGLGSFMANQLNEASWEGIARARPWEGLGMNPRDPTFGMLDSSWSALPSAIAIAVLVMGLIAIRRRPGATFVLIGLVVGVAGAVVLPLISASPYLSFKLVVYTAPFAILIAVTPLIALGHRHAVWALYVAAGFMLVTGTLRFGDAQWPQSGTGTLAQLRAIATEASERAHGGAVEIAVGAPGGQEWLVYFLRDRQVSLPCPSIYFTGIGLTINPREYVHPSSVSIVIEDGRPRLWSQGAFELVNAPAHNPRGCFHTRPAGLVEVAGTVGA